MRNLEDKLAELERLEKAATPGPWESRQGTKWSSIVQVREGWELAVANVHLGAFTAPKGQLAANVADAALISATRNSLPGLLKAVRGMAEALEFYERESNYSEDGAPGRGIVRDHPGMDGPEYDFDPDYGTRARSALLQASKDLGGESER